MNRNTASVYLDTRRPSGRHQGKYPVKIKVIFYLGPTKWQRVYYPCKIYLNKKEFDRITKGAKTDSDIAKHTTIYTALNQAISILNRVNNINYKTFDQLYNASGSDITSLSEFFKVRIKQLEAEDRGGDLHIYTYAAKSFEAFNKTTVYFNDVTTDWLERYEKHMIKKGESTTTIGMYLRALRATLNIAVRDNLMMPHTYPFGKGKHKIKTERKIKIPLNDTQVQQLKDYVPVGMMEDRARALWLFSYYGNGMNLYDIFKLRHNDIINGFIVFDRAKARRTTSEVRKIIIPMRPEFTYAITRYGNRTLDPNGLLFPLLDGCTNSIHEKERLKTFGKRLNAELKKIGEKLAININLRMGIARHTFTNRLLNQGISNEYLQYALGHSNPSTTEHYKGSFMIDTIEKTSKLL